MDIQKCSVNFTPVVNTKKFANTANDIRIFSLSDNNQENKPYKNTEKRKRKSKFDTEFSEAVIYIRDTAGRENHKANK